MSGARQVWSVAGVLLVAWCGGRVGAQEAAEPARAFVAASAEPSDPYAGEVVTVRLRIGLDAELVRDDMWLQPFSRPLDLPAVVRAAWWRRPPDGLVDLGPPDGFAPTGRLVVEGDLEGYRRLAETSGPEPGRRYVVVETVRRFVAPEAGPVFLAAPTLEASYATAFEENFFGDRIPKDRVRVEAEASTLGLRVRPVPTAGRPPSWNGGVGAFAVSARLEARDGGGARAVFEIVPTRAGIWRGAVPGVDTEALSGAGVLGVREVEREGGDGGRRIEVDFADATGADGAPRIPSLPVAWFDPRTGSFEVAWTPPLDAGGDRGRAADDGGAPGPDLETARRLFGAEAVDGLRGLRRWSVAPPAATDPRWVLAPWALTAVLALVLALVRIRAVRSRLALGRLRAGLRRGPDAGRRAVAAFLARILGRPEPAVVDPDLAETLRLAGASPGVAEAMARGFMQMQSLRFARPGESPHGSAAVDGGRAQLETAASTLVLQVPPPAAPPARRRVTWAGVLAVAGALGLVLAVAVRAGLVAAAGAPTPAASDDGVLAAAMASTAAERYARGEYGRARAAFEAALRGAVLPWQRAALLHGLGNCAVREGRAADAVLRYRQSLALDRTHPDAEATRANLRLAAGRLGLHATPAGPLAVAADRLRAVPMEDAVSWGLVLSAAGLLGAAFASWRCGHGRGGAAALLLFLGLGGLGPVAVAVRQGVADAEPPGAAVALVDLAIRARPLPGAAVLRTVSAGSTLRVLESSSRWAHVAVGGVEGWIDRSVDEGVLEEIEPGSFH